MVSIPSSGLNASHLKRVSIVIAERLFTASVSDHVIAIELCLMSEYADGASIPSVGSGSGSGSGVTGPPGVVSIDKVALPSFTIQGAPARPAFSFEASSSGESDEPSLPCALPTVCVYQQLVSVCPSLVLQNVFVSPKSLTLIVSGSQRQFSSVTPAPP